MWSVRWWKRVREWTEKTSSIMPNGCAMNFHLLLLLGFLHGKMKPKRKKWDHGSVQWEQDPGAGFHDRCGSWCECAQCHGDDGRKCRTVCLAQLHQLRGRVGRGQWQSYCIFIHGKNQAEKSKRLQILNKSNDGFYIAQEDLKLPGAGWSVWCTSERRFELWDRWYLPGCINPEKSQWCSRIYPVTGWYTGTSTASSAERKTGRICRKTDRRSGPVSCVFEEKLAKCGKMG